METGNYHSDDHFYSKQIYQTKSDKLSTTERKVHFAITPIVHKSIPWTINSDSANLGTELENLTLSEQNIFETENAIKNEFIQLRPPYHINNRPTALSFVLSFFFLVLIFLIICRIAEKLLIIEIEQQVTNTFSNIYNHIVENKHR